MSYLDPDDPASPLYIRRMHSAYAHNEYGNADGRAGPPPITWKGLFIDSVEFVITVDDQALPRYLTRIEWQLLRALIRDFGRVVTQEVLIKRVWGSEYGADDAHLLRVHMARLRKKISPEDPGRFITTSPGIGYSIGVLTAVANGAAVITVVEDE